MESIHGRRGVAALTLALGLAGAGGCVSWRPQGVSPEMVIAREQPEAVRVTLTDSTMVVVRSPTVVADTLRGHVDGEPRIWPVGEIAAIAVRRGDGGKTAGLVLGLGVGSLLGLAALIAATW